MVRICSKCVLPETFPGIRFNEEGVCQFCERHARIPEEKIASTTERFVEKFEGIIDTVRGKGAYDVLMAYSGGKDSTYTLFTLVKKYGLKAVAFTFDQGYISGMALENISKVCSALNVDHVKITPGLGTMNRAFKASVVMDVYPIKALERASAICNTCMYLAKASFLKAAIEMRIPLVAYGWSPGQAPIQSSVMKLNPSMIQQSQTLMVESLGKIMEGDLFPYLLQDRHYSMITEANAEMDGHFLYNVHPLAFLNYNEETILGTIRDLGWRHPTDTDSNSSNCLLNSLANRVHLDRYNFHPYAFENAGLVRDGYMLREDGLEKLSREMNEELISQIRRKMGI